MGCWRRGRAGWSVLLDTNGELDWLLAVRGSVGSAAELGGESRVWRTNP